MRVTVVGGGRMGLPLACRIAERGAHVIVADINESLVDSVNNGYCLYEEPGLAQLLRELYDAGRISALKETSRACQDANVVIVIVPAHLTRDNEIDFDALRWASIEVGKGLNAGALVSYETTISIGGTRNVLIPLLEANSGLVVGKDFHVAFSPERVKANQVLARLRETPKVVGGFDRASRDLAASFYKEFLGAPVEDVGSLEAAEMTKLVGMLYRDVNIALANELASFCEAAGVDFERVRVAANTDGEAQLLIPGIGVGGHCTPVYPYFLIRESRRLGIAQRISATAREVNDGQPIHQVDRLCKACQTLADKSVHILGLGFRPGVKVEAFSPTYSLRDELVKRGAYVTLEDPYYTVCELTAAGFNRGDAMAADIVILSTAHPEFAEVDFLSWSKAGVQAVLDGRNLWDREKVEAAGLLYLGIGRGFTPEKA